jgi:Fe-S cluster biogenesis protein NfuA
MEAVSTETPVDISPRSVTPTAEPDAQGSEVTGDADPGDGVTDADLMRIALDAAVEAIRPAIQMDGGDMIVHELRVEEGVVDIELTGACVGCPMSTVTLKQGVERILTDRVPGLKQVRAKGIDYDVVDDAW